MYRGSARTSPALSLAPPPPQEPARQQKRPSPSLARSRPRTAAEAVGALGWLLPVKGGSQAQYCVARRRRGWAALRRHSKVPHLGLRRSHRGKPRAAASAPVPAAKAVPSIAHLRRSMLKCRIRAAGGTHARSRASLLVRTHGCAPCSATRWASPTPQRPRLLSQATAPARAQDHAASAITAGAPRARGACGSGP
jgi:hypothetical protein